jgi:outer membrane protein assembly factor BamA
MTSQIAVKVEAFEIEGNHRTKLILFQQEFDTALQSRSLEELHIRLEQTTQRLKSFGIFASIDTKIRVSDLTQEKANVKVLVTVKEKGIPNLKVY